MRWVGAESAAGGLQAADAWLDLVAGSGRRDCERWGEETPCQGCFLPYPWLVAPQTVGMGGRVDELVRLAGNQ